MQKSTYIDTKWVLVALILVFVAFIVSSSFLVVSLLSSFSDPSEFSIIICSKCLTNLYHGSFRLTRGVYFSRSSIGTIFLFLATSHWQFRSLCIWSLIKLLCIGLKSQHFYIYCIYNNHLRTCHPLSPKFELLNFVWPGRCRKVSKTYQTVLRESSATRNVAPKIIPKMSCYALSGDLTGVTSVTNHSIFVKWPEVKLLGLKRGFLHHKMPLRPQIWPQIAKNLPSQNHPQNSTFCSVSGQTAVTLVSNRSIFNKWP